MQLLWPLKTGGRPAHQFLHPTHRFRPSLSPSPTLPPDLFFHPERPEWAEFPRPLHVFLSQSRGALTPSPAGRGQTGADPWSAPLASALESEEEEGAQRQTAAPPQPPSPSSATRGRGEGGGGRGDDRGRGGALNARAQLRWRGGSAGSRRRRLGGTGPGLGRLRSPQPRPCRSPAAAPWRAGPRAPLRHHHHPWKGGAHKEKRGRGPAGGGAGSPGAERPGRFATAPRSRPTQGARQTGPLLSPQAGSGTDSLSSPPSLSPSKP